MLSACGTSGGSNGDSFGSISFSLIAPADDASAVQYRSASFPCEEYPVASVEAEVLDARGNLVAAGGPWECSGGRGTIGYIKAGDNYTLWVYLRNPEGQVRFQGSLGGLRVRMGRITNAAVELHRINLTPVFEEIASQQTRAGQYLGFDVTATDPDGDPLSYSASTLPPGATFDATTHTFSWTPQYYTKSMTRCIQPRAYTVRFTVADNGIPSESDWEDVRITVLFE